MGAARLNGTGRPKQVRQLKTYKMTKIFFVCLGNICRSPLAEGICQQLIEQKRLDGKYSCDSCGTSAYNIGQQPDPRTQENAKINDINLNHKARQFDVTDFEEFDYILPMDASNMMRIVEFGEAETSKVTIKLMREFDPLSKGADVPDPYFGGEEGFQDVFEILDRSCKELLDHLESLP